MSTSDLSPDPSAFWNTNIPPSQHTVHCPSYLQYAFDNAKDRAILSTLDADYQRQTWQQVQEFIRDNRLDLFQRLPSDLRRYREYSEKLTGQWGSVMAFVMGERLGWGDGDLRDEAGEGLKNEGDVKMLYNDWPYGVDARIVHLVIWTKFPLQSEPITEKDPNGDLTEEARQMVNRFVHEKFVGVCGRENVIWFKNWSSLKSIHAVEHFHVMLWDPPEDFVREVTRGDVPLAEKVRKAEEASGRENGTSP